MTRPVCYVFGPYSGEVEKNIEAATVVAVELWDLGYSVLCPHTNTAHFEKRCKVADYDDFLAGCLEFVDRSDLLVGLPNWAISPGGKREYSLAQEKDIPVYFWPAVPPVDVFIEAHKEKNRNCLLKADELVGGERQRDYGHPYDNMGRIAKLWEVILETKIARWQVALCMVAVKIARLIETPRHKDGPIDMAGYARAYEMVIDEEEKRTL